MLLPRLKLGKFIIKTTLSLGALSLLWPIVSPFYEKLLVLTFKVMPWFDLLVKDGSFFIYRSTALTAGIRASALHFGTILLLALVISVPGLNPLARIKLIGTALAAVFAIQTITLLLLATFSATGASLTLPAILLSSIGFNLFPVVIWVALYVIYGQVHKPSNKSCQPLEAKAD